MKLVAPRSVWLRTLLALALASVSALTLAQAGNDVTPAPPSIGADVPLTYFGPAPSQVQKELIGPFQLLKSGTVDQEAGTVTIPLYQGQMASGELVWYILTDTDDAANAAALGLNASSKLTYAAVGKGVRSATLEDDATLTFASGTVDFSPELALTPGQAPNLFPPSDFQPGAVGDEDYSPLIKVENAGGHIYNAPIVAFGTSAEELNLYCGGHADHSVTHDKVVAICPKEQTVTLKLTPGFSFARPNLYLSMDASDPLAATLENVTLAPGLNSIPLGRDDSAFSAVERIFVFTNGPTGKENPQRQGLNSAIAGEGSSLNVLGGIPTVATDYSPLWDMNLGSWTQEAIDKGYRSRLTEEFAILGFAEKGWLTGPEGAPYGSVGIVINCPIVFRFL